jgi:hypothetical protein
VKRQISSNNQENEVPTLIGKFKRETNPKSKKELFIKVFLVMLV